LSGWSTASAGPATLLGTVKAPKREAALAKAYDEFGAVSPRDRERIIVQRTSDHA
jgi:hypothetical protein